MHVLHIALMVPTYRPRGGYHPTCIVKFYLKPGIVKLDLQLIDRHPCSAGRWVRHRNFFHNGTRVGGSHRYHQILTRVVALPTSVDANETSSSIMT